ncbi:MAG: hypothetical protein M1834_006468 [Cirrosporium novae-zelandiae]|nr:MAG: hypothetical protein M1834_006468 [Cirrosporium novae-zelandiae]
MPGLQIPLDALASRFNLQGRFDSLRSQSVTSRFANLKPISEFCDFKRLSKPHNFSEVQSRVNYNLSYFSSNYFLVFLMLSVYSLLTNLLLLFVIMFVTGGWWAIMKLDGRDLELGMSRVTTSQLWTGLLVIAVPLGIWASPISTILWLIGATGVTVLECFFRGGGLGGRPRTPYDTPQWGRPSGARPGRKEKKWGREWEEHSRFEEVGSDEDNGDGVGLAVGFRRGKRHVSDELRFDGIDLGSRRARQQVDYDYEGETDYSDEVGYADEAEHQRAIAAKIALREKEDLICDKAMYRIRRAQAKGQPDVNLTREELDALEHRRQRYQVDEARSANKAPKVKSRRVSGTPPTRAIEPSRHKHRPSTGSNRSDPQTPPYSSSSVTRVPVGYYSNPSSAGGSRTPSQSQQKPPSPFLPYPPSPTYLDSQSYQWYYPGQESYQSQHPGSSSSSPRPPDDSSRHPRARSTSNLGAHSAEPVRQYPYPVTHSSRHQLDSRAPYPPRNVSGPPDYSSMSKRTPIPISQLVSHQIVTSEPELGGRMGDDDESEDEGVRIGIVPPEMGASGYDTKGAVGDSNGRRRRKKKRR